MCARRFFSLASVIAVLGPAVAGASPRIYVSEEDAGAVAVIDTATDAVVDHIKVGKRPRGLKLAPDGKTLYVALSGSPRGGPGVDESKLPPADRTADGIGVVDLVAGKLTKVLPSGQDPESFDLSRDGKRLFVSNEETAEMSVVDLGRGVVSARVKVGKEPEGVTVRPDGKVVYVVCEQDNLVVAVSTSSLKVLARIEVGARPRSIVFSNDGKVGFVAAENAALLTVVDVAKHKASGEIKIVSTAGKPMPPRPMTAVLSPDGKQLYVSNGRGESIAVVDVVARTVLKVIEDVGARPWGIGLGPDGRTIYTANGPSNDVSVVDLETGKVRKKIKVGGLPWGLVVAGPQLAQ